MEQAYIIAHLKGISVPELLDALAEAHAGEPIDIYENFDSGLINRTTTAVWEFVEAIRKVNAPALSS